MSILTEKDPLRDVQGLIKKDFKPSLHVLLHRNALNKVCSCCQAALASFQASVISAGSRSHDGLYGILAYLSHSFAWGITFSTFLCEMLQNNLQLDCGAMTSLAILAIQLYRDYIKSNPTLQAADWLNDITLANVQMIGRDDPSNISMIRRSLLEKFEHSHSYYSSWLQGCVYYHQCLGIIKPSTKQLLIWDYEKFEVPDNYIKSGNNLGIVAIRVNPIEQKGEGIVQWNNQMYLMTSTWQILANVDTETNDSSSFGQLLSSAGSTDISSDFSLSSPPLSLSQNNLTAPSPPLSTTNKLKVFISACHMSSNPNPGLGLARSLRKWSSSKDAGIPVTSLYLVGIDDACRDQWTGLTDPIFDEVRDMASYGELYWSSPFPAEKKIRLEDMTVWQRELWENIVDMLSSEDETCFYLPGVDRDVFFLAAIKSSLLSSTFTVDDAKLSQYADIASHILCPTQESLRLTLKPYISGAVSMMCFLTPPFLLLDLSLSFEEISAQAILFCDEIDYPVLVKGTVTGATVCNDWTSVMLAITSLLPYLRSQGQNKQVFIQKMIHGRQKTIAFSAYRGQLTGLLQMSKIIVNQGKVWSGLIEPVEEGIVQSLADFVATAQWTGGGELEFIESIEQSLDHSKARSRTKKWFIIDFNTRFPAWIYAGALKNLNLPGDLLEHALRFAGEKEWSYKKYLDFTPFSFTRTTVEQLTAHINIGVYMTDMEGSNRNYMVKGSNQSSSNTNEEWKNTKVINGDGHDVNDVAHIAPSGWMHSLLQEASTILISSSSTPLYFLSSNLLKENFVACKDLLQSTLESGLSTSVPPLVKVQLCLSVKTQPHSAVLSLAREKGYLAECITSSEVDSALDAGYTEDQIVLTGPGKFWKGHGHHALSSDRKVKGKKLAAVFADSYADLVRIIQRLNNPEDELDASVIGVRFQPPGLPSTSRFGIDSGDALLLELTAELICNDLPAHILLGVHFHHASSSPLMGLTKWFGMARAMLHLAMQFSSLCHRSLAVLDLGGGFHPHIVQSKEMKEGLIELFTEVESKVKEEMQSIPVQSRLGTNEMNDKGSLRVQFELGKCVTQNAGGLLCRILEIREISISRSHSSFVVPEKRAMIVDACVGEVFIPHFHPLYWCKAGSQQWKALTIGGKDEVWGRSCMEFDVLVGGRNGWGKGVGSCGAGALGVLIPEDMEVGDILLIGATGAYDMSMSYAFADGQGRSHCVVVP